MSDQRETVLEVRDLCVEFNTAEGKVQAVSGLDYVLHAGEKLGIVGESGSGKSVSSLAVMGLIPNPPGKVTEGQILYRGQDILKKSQRELEKLRGNEISMIFQEPMTSLNPIHRCGSQIAESLRLHRGMNKKQAMEEAVKLMKAVGIANPEARALEYPHQMSGGMRQRVMIAMALACRPNILIADEPTTALDVTIQAQILREMQDLKEQHDMSMIMITHDLGIVAQVCDEVAVIYAGRIVEYGDIREVFKDTRHPYTQGLFDSLPKINDDREMLDPIPGMMPDPMELPEGCAFAPRCKYATEKCSQALPPKTHFSEKHYAACWRYEDPTFSLKGGQNA